MRLSKFYWLLLIIFMASCSRKVIIQKGKASYYADKFHGRKTASGQIFDQTKTTAAHKTLPFGTQVTVKNLNNGRKVNVTINDRGPFVAGRIIDLSKRAATEIDLVRAGVASVEISYKNKKRFKTPKFVEPPLPPAVLETVSEVSSAVLNK